jgi:hypothetical protein
LSFAQHQAVPHYAIVDVLSADCSAEYPHNTYVSCWTADTQEGDGVQALSLQKRLASFCRRTGFPAAARTRHSALVINGHQMF